MATPDEPQKAKSPFDESTHAVPSATTATEQALRPTKPSRPAVALDESAPSVTRGRSLAPAELALLRRHTINLNAGRFSTDGDLRTERYDVEALFGEFLPQWIENRTSDDPPRLVLYAHGGLISEEAGAEIALRDIPFWTQNDIYPVFFVWETGFIESIMQLWSGETRRSRELAAGRGWYDDARDRMWEELSRALGARHIWSGMKRSAERTFQEEGDGGFIIEQLRALSDRDDRLEVHLIGHSAGSIFWAHGLPPMAEAGLEFGSLQLMAPAATNELFRRHVLPLVGEDKPVERCTLFTLLKEYELDDSVGPYRKSLLYLIHHALEAERQTPILGLEISLRPDPALAQFFGLGRNASPSPGEIVWSVTRQTTGTSASQATTHGMFDNDPATMQSIVRRIKRLEDDRPVVRFMSRGISVPGLEEWETLAPNRFLQGYPEMSFEMYSGPTSRESTRSLFGDARSNSKRALCIGIDNYPEPGDRLGGCVNDARQWQRLFESRGFQTRTMTDRQATRRRLLDAIDELISSSRAGDVVAIHLSCHGTQVLDYNSDDEDRMDEAVVPYDHRTEGYMVDDDISKIADKIPAGVNVSFFMDLCHSGSATRFAIGAMDRHSSEAKVRFLPADAEMQEVHRSTAPRGRGRTRDAYRGRPEILFAACAPHQTAKERGDQGDFTRYALQVLRNAGDQLTNAGFIDEVLRIGRFENQDPALWADRSFHNSDFLSSREREASPAGDHGGNESASIASDAVRDMERALERLRNAI